MRFSWGILATGCLLVTSAHADKLAPKASAVSRASSTAASSNAPSLGAPSAASPTPRAPSQALESSTLTSASTEVSDPLSDPLSDRFADDHDSVSCGSTNRGALSDAAVMPVEGPGFIMAEPWRSRETRYGTHELVNLIQRSAKKVARLHKGSKLSVADMSLESGGPIAMHRSHQNGRDVDLVYYAMDAEGAPFYPDSHMAYYTRRGMANYAQSPAFIKNIPERYFDLKRNWALVNEFISDPDVDVERIFVSPRIKRWLLAYAKEVGTDEELLKKAARILHAPRAVKGHNDHMHVRIACSADDIEQGRCRNESASRPKSGVRWHRHMTCPRPALKPVLPQI